MKKPILFLSLLIFNLFAVANYSLLIGEVRYVSHSGSNTPPYLTWETAADSIMSAINISSFGDTIYVANGVYQEQVVMIPGLSLIGAGMDSCVVDTRVFISSTLDNAIVIADSCLLENFQVLVSNNSSLGRGISGMGNPFCLVQSNKVINAKYGIFLDATFFGVANFSVIENMCINVDVGIELFNSSSMISGNIISTSPNSPSSIVAGIKIGAFDFSYHPLIDSNLIIVNGAGGYGIYQSFGATLKIINNDILLRPGDGMALGYSDSGKVYNNLIYGRGYGINNRGTQFIQIYNNYIAGEIGKGIIAGPDNEIKNNVITDAEIGIEKWYNQATPIVKYNDLWDNDLNTNYFTPDSSNLSLDPMIVNNDSTQGELDFHLQMFSPLINGGDPGILDKDNTRSDIGLYGGPYGESYKYLDLPPRAPVNLSATIDTDYILIRWNKNTEADLGHYDLYRDTTENFTIDSTTFVVSIPDTFYFNLIPQGIDNLYFKLTAVDNQGNESKPSEELHVLLTGTIKNKEFTIDNYRLYQNYPNPFNPTTKIDYRLKERGYVKLYVYDIKGELVKTLVNQYQEEGYYEVEFIGTDNQRPGTSNKDLASGIYIYQLMVRNEQNIPVYSDIKKMILLK